MRVYHYPNCSTCKKALRYLRERGHEPTLTDIVKQPPSRDELEQIWRASGLPLRRFFNTSGQSYRGGGFKERLPQMRQSRQLDALAADGKLIRRTLLVAQGIALLGFKTPEWDAALT